MNRRWGGNGVCLYFKSMEPRDVLLGDDLDALFVWIHEHTYYAFIDHDGPPTEGMVECPATTHDEGNFCTLAVGNYTMRLSLIDLTNRVDCRRIINCIRVFMQRPHCTPALREQIQAAIAYLTIEGEPAP